MSPKQREQRYQLPQGLRYASLSERRSFYTKEFKLKRFVSWLSQFRDPNNVIYSLIIGRHTGIYPARFEKIRNDMIIISDYDELEELRDYLLRYLPESIYYDRNLFEDRRAVVSCSSYPRCWRHRHWLGQELAFDIDPENIDCPIHGDIAQKMARHQALSFCELEFELARSWTLKLHELLEKNFSELRIVYSGRGFHIHLFDRAALGLTRRERRSLARAVAAKGFPIDEWVVAGRSRLIRLPYSLHGMVSRIVLPLKLRELENFDLVKNKQAIPLFAQRSARLAPGFSVR